MSDEIIKPVEDHYQEHELHKELADLQCSDCWIEFKQHMTTAHLGTEQTWVCETCERFANVKPNDAERNTISS